MIQELMLPALPEALAELRAGQELLLSGTLLTARDAAHACLAEMVRAGEDLPIDLQGQAIYYAGPCPAPPGRPIGSCGPTTSARMDPYMDLMLSLGARVFIGKGPRSQKAMCAMAAAGGVYLAAPGGAGALLAECVTHSRVVAFENLGTEAVRALTICRLPVIVAFDTKCQDVYVLGVQKFLED